MKSYQMTNPVQSHKSALAMYADAKAENAAGRRMVATLQRAEDERTLLQNKFLWGFVYKNISRQALAMGMGAEAEGWHYYYKKMFLGYEFTKVKVPGQKRPSVTRTLRSSTKLGIGQMSTFLDKVMAHAATTFTVTFPAGITWSNYQGDRW